MSLLRCICLLLLATCLGAQELPKQISGGPGQPLSPAEAQKLFRLTDGLRIELVAAEPQIESPVAMAFDPRGRLWVVEMRDYPNGPAKGQPPEGRIKILEDKNRDGFFETATIFADELLFANGLLHWKDGVIVTAAPHILWLRDTDGDDKADKKEVLFEGFAAQNPQLRVSHPILGLDGWIYVANGLRGGAVARPGDKEGIKLSGMDFRFDPLYGGFEAITGMGQFGNTFDDWGQRFVCDNRHHLRHIVLENRYVERNPNLAAATLVNDISVLEDGPLSSGGKIYPLSKNWTTSSLHEGRFTAACGVFIYRGARLPQAARGAAFTCDPTGNLVHQEVLTQHGASFTAQPPHQGIEFLATPDDWFRPVFLGHGPDDALYVVDMYRAVIEHPDFMPPELQKRPDLNRGKEKGRIWRIVPNGQPAQKPAGGDLAKLASSELSALLADARPWQRSTAHRLLLERQDTAAVEPLRRVLEAKTPEGKVHAAWLLESMVYLDEPRLLALLDDAHPRVRENAVKLAEVRLSKSPALQEKLLTLQDDPDPRVRCQVALALGYWDSDRIVGALAAIAARGAADPWTRLAVASSLVAPEDEEDFRAPTSRAFPVLEAIVKTPAFAKLAAEPKAALLREFGALMLNEPVGIKPAALAQELRDPRAALALCNGFADGLARKGVRFDDYFLKGFPNPNNPTLEWLRDFLGQVAKLAGESKAEPSERLAAIRLLAHLSWQQTKQALPALLEDPSQDIRLAAVRAMAAHRDSEVPALLLKGWRRYTPAVRREVTDAMFRTPDRMLLLLGEIEAKRVRPGDLDALRTRQLLNHGQPNIRVLADKLLRGNLPADRQQVMKDYQQALSIAGDAKRGLEIFKKNCATCHRVAGVGLDVGPDIADTRTKTLAALLTDILVPNQAIDNNYVNYLVATTDGKSLTGIIVAETATSITLKRAEGQTDTILRSQIDEIQSSGVSLMPEGLEKTISVTEMADLLAFLKNWRYLDGTVPLSQQ